MKALSIRQPYASAIIFGWKTVEIRSWKTKYRGDLLICSTQKEFRSEDGTIFPGGYALGVVELLDVHKMTKNDLLYAYEPAGTRFEDYINHYAWIIALKHKIVPFHVKGKQGFYEVDHEIEIILN
ncbi:MAG: ASCH domain-containing protein [Desulfovibrio sp.]|nr:ASCH domain-containing protein [Desulfovibrio sp.]